MPNVNDVVAQLTVEQPGTDFVIISHPIDRELHEKLTDEIGQRKGAARRCTVFLTTYGGDPHAGFRVARCLRHNYDHVRVVVPSYCKSAGTLVVIAANELVLGDLGELGPLDVQVTKPSEVIERGSGLDYMQALQVGLTHAQLAFNTFLETRRGGIRLPTKLAGELATRMACGLVEPLYAQIDPNRIGEMQRAIQIAQDYGSRLDEGVSNLKDGALEQLVIGYPSHGFVIDRKEARNLFTSVQSPSVAERLLCTVLWGLLKEQRELCSLLEHVAPPTPENANAEQTPEAGGATSQAAVPHAGSAEPAG